MYNPSLKSKVIENQTPFRSMRSSKDSSDNDLMAATTTGGATLLPCLDVDENDVAKAPPTSVVIVEPRRMRSKSTSSSTSNSLIRNTANGNDNGSFRGRFGGNMNRFRHPPPERFILPQAVDAGYELRRLGNSVSAVMTISFGLLFHERILQRPGCEEGLRSITDYAHQILTTLMQPLALAWGRPMSSNTNRREPSIGLLPQSNRVGAGFFGLRFGSSSSSSRQPAEWFMLPRPDEANADLMCLVSRLTSMITILIRLIDPEHTRQHPEREQGMRQMLHHAHQMFNTLLEPRPNSSDGHVSSNTSSLLHLLYDQAPVPPPSRAEGMSGGFGGRSGGTSSSSRDPPEGFLVPEAIDVRTDLRCLVNSLMAVAIILTGLRAHDRTRQQPEREEGLRMMLHYTHEMFNTLMQPLPFSGVRPISFNTGFRLPSISLLENIYDPMPDPEPERRAAAEGMPGGGDNGGTHHSTTHPPEGIGLLPVDANSDLMSLVNSLMITVLILIRVNAPEYTRQHPERVEGMSQMLHSAHQMINTLLQPPPISSDRAMSPNTNSLLQLLYEQMSVPTTNRTEVAEGSQLDVAHAPNFVISANMNWI